MPTKNILAFEADPLYAQLLIDTYGTCGFAVEIVTDGIAGLEKASTTSPNLIYLSIELPRVSGFSICNKLRKNPESMNIPMVIVSAEATEETFEKHRKLRVHADEYLLKPFGPEDLLSIAEQYLGPLPADIVEKMQNGFADDEELIIEEGDDEELVINELDDLDEFNALDKLDAPEKGAPQNLRVDEDISAFADQAFNLLKREDSVSASISRPTLKEPSGSYISPKQAGSSAVPSPPPFIAEPADGNAVTATIAKKDAEISVLKEAIAARDKRLHEEKDRVEDLKRKLAATSDDASKISRITEEYENQITQLRADKELLAKKADDQQTRVTHLQERNRAQLEEIEKFHLEKEELERAFEFERDELISRLDNREAEFEELKEGQKAQLKTALENERKLADKEFRASLEEALINQRLRHSDEINALRRQLETEKKSVLESQGRDADRRVYEIEDEHKRNLTDVLDRLALAEKTAQALRQENTELVSMLRDARDELTGTVAELERVGTKYAENERTTQDQASHIRILETSLQEANKFLTRNGDIAQRARRALDIALQLVEELQPESDEGFKAEPIGENK